MFRMPYLAAAVPFCTLVPTLSGCAAPGKPADPVAGEVRLDSRGGFDAYLLHESDVGIWTVECLPFFAGHGCPNVVALDDKGRCTVLSSYSGKWTPWTLAHDGKWLGGIAHGDLDPRFAGPELYVGGQGGNLYQIRPHPQGGFDSCVIAYLPGCEIHTLVLAELDDTHAGMELLAFTSPGGLYLVEPKSGDNTSFRCHLLQDLPGRVRDAVVIRGSPGGPPRVATASRNGDLSLLTLHGGRAEWRKVLHVSMGLGRVAAAPRAAGEPIVLYVTCDDGRVIRLQERGDGAFDSEIIHAGPQGPRGIAAGRFHSDPDRESVAVFGYSREVEMISRGVAGWESQVIFRDRDKGHWLTTGELDGRNSTDEIVVSGYGARVVMLARPPGYGLAPGITPTSR